MLQWPSEAGRRKELAERGVPRLLLVDRHADPPLVLDCLEDWSRIDASEADVQTRLAALEARAGVHREPAPILDDDGVLRFNSLWVALPPVEARLAAQLVERFGTVVSRDALSRAGWPSTPTGRNALDVHILRLRRRIHRVGLSIRTVRSRGYLMERTEGLERAAGYA